jgi:hypothetical protein
LDRLIWSLMAERQIRLIIWNSSSVRWSSGSYPHGLYRYIVGWSLQINVWQCIYFIMSFLWKLLIDDDDRDGIVLIMHYDWWLTSISTQIYVGSSLTLIGWTVNVSTILGQRLDFIRKRITSSFLDTYFVTLLYTDIDDVVHYLWRLWGCKIIRPSLIFSWEHDIDEWHTNHQWI